MFRIAAEKCTSCGMCKTECPIGAIFENFGVYEINMSMCISCGSCQKICAADAIKGKKR